MQDEIKTVLSALARVQDHLGPLPELLKELSTPSIQLAPVLEVQKAEIMKLEMQISQKQESDAYKLSEKLADLQLQMSEQSLKGRMDAIKERIDQAVEGFGQR
jgi:hypothetical protein